MRRGLLFLLVFCLAASAGAIEPSPLIREQRSIVIDGVKEVWQLQWRKKPHPACAASGDEWMTCPCNGFAFGEAGQIDLVRLRGGKEIDRLALTPFFDLTEFSLDSKEATLARWPVKDGDASNSATLDAAQVRRRAPVRILDFADYDHHGRADAFFLQLSTLPCGKPNGIVIGLGRDPAHLHLQALGTALHPGTPLLLQKHEWDALKASAVPVTATDWPCADHGSDTLTQIDLSTGKDGITPVSHEYQCLADGARGALVHEKKW